MEKGKKNEELFCSMPVPQAILTLAVPTVVSQIITIIYNMADTFFIGQLGDPKPVSYTHLREMRPVVWALKKAIWTRQSMSCWSENVRWRSAVLRKCKKIWTYFLRM